MFMDFRFKSRLGKTWDQDSLGRVLALNYPGCKTLEDALKQAILKNPTSDPIKSNDTSLIGSPDQIETLPTKASPTITPIDEQIDF